MNDQIASVFTKRNANTRLTVYTYNKDERLSFEWEDPDADPMQTGNVWTLINPSASQSVRELDRTLTDDVLLREMARSEGFEYDSLRQPKDVILTRNKLMLILNDGSRHSFDIESAPFLRDINPNEPILNFCGKGSKIQINMK